MSDSRESSILHVLLALFEHLEHSIGDDKSAEHVCGTENNGHETESAKQRRVRRTGDEHRTKDDDSVDRIRRGHERRVENGRHPRYHLEADKDRENENVDAEYKLVAHDVLSDRRWSKAALRI